MIDTRFDDNEGPEMADADKWDKRELGADEKYVAVVSKEDEVRIDESLGLKPITIRLQASLIKDFETAARKQGLKYQTLMRQVLTKYIAELKSQDQISAKR